MNMQDTKQHEDLTVEIAAPIEHFGDFRSRFRKYVPDAMIDFVVGFLLRIQTLTGIAFHISLPENLATLPRNIHRAFPVLDVLKERGVITSVSYRTRAHADEPMFHATQIELDRRRKSIGYLGRSSSLFSEDETWWPAIGEAVERWCLFNYTPPRWDTRHMTVAEGAQKSGLDLWNIAGFSPEWRADRASKNLALQNESSLLWTSVTPLTEDAPSHAPLQWFTLDYAQQAVRRTQREPVISSPISTGAATGKTRTHALLGGMLEVIERDAFIIHWLRKITPQKIDLGSIHHPRIKKIRDLAERYHLEVHILYLATDMPAHVAAAVTIDRTGVGPAVNIDTSAGFDLIECIERAVTNTFVQRDFMRTQMSKGAHLQYKDTNPETLNISSRLSWWSFTERLPLIDFFIRGESLRIENVRNFSPPKRTADQLSMLVRACEQEGYSAFYKNIMPPTLAKALAPLSTVFVRMPDFQPLYLNERERATGGTRLTDIPQKLNLHPGATVHEIPHPFL